MAPDLETMTNRVEEVPWSMAPTNDSDMVRLEEGRTDGLTDGRAAGSTRELKVVNAKIGGFFYKGHIARHHLNEPTKISSTTMATPKISSLASSLAAALAPPPPKVTEQVYFPADYRP